MQINGRSFYLRSLIKKDINKEYLSWLKDSEVNQFLEVRFSPPTMKQALERLRKYDNKKNFFFGIFDKQNDKFIGTMSLCVNLIHKTGYHGYLIGEKNYWGKNAAISSLALLLDFAFKKLCLHKIYGQTYINNVVSIFNFKKLGFYQEGRLREHAVLQSKPADILIFGILKNEWLKKRKKFVY